MDPRLGTAIVVVVGVPAVLIGYIYAHRAGCSRFAPDRLAAAIRPWLWLAAGACCSWRVPRLPDDPDDHPQLPGQGSGTAFVGLDNYAWFFTNVETPRSRCATTRIWLVAADAVHRRRSAC